MSEILISRFHPAIEEASALESIFVGKERKDYVEEILKELEEEITSDRYLQSRFFYGPAGIGKTFLLSIIFHRIKKNSTLSKNYFPVLLPEELFGVRNVAEIILRVLETIVTPQGRIISDEENKKIQRYVEDKISWVKEAKSKEQRFNRGKSVLYEIKERFGKRTIIMIENLDRLVPSFKKEELNNLLSILPRSKSLKILATAATFIRDMGKIGSPIYGYFKKNELTRLTNEECFELISRIQEFYAREYPKLTQYFRSPEGKRRIRIFQAISYLSGGLPRMIFPLFEIALAECERESDGKGAKERWQSSLGFMQEMFEKLTLIYREALWALPTSQREIIEIFAQSQTSLQPKEIENLTHLSSKEVSTYILRLIERGWLRNVTETMGKKRFYILSEPLFPIWYRWRRGGSPEERWLFVIYLLAYMFTEEELRYKESVSEEMKGIYLQAISLKPEIESIITQRARFIEAPIEKGITKPDIEIWLDKADASFKLGRYEEALKAYDYAIKLKPDFAEAWYNKGVFLGNLGRYEEELKAYDYAIKLKPDFAEAWYNKGLTLIYSIKPLLLEKNYGLVKERIEVIKAMLSSDRLSTGKIEEDFISFLRELFREGLYKEMEILKGIFLELKWESYLERFSPLWTASKMGEYLDNDKPLEALKILERLDAVNRKAIERVLEIKYGKDWFKEAKEKMRSLSNLF
ncbi:MAG: tetratricopeptide repeat protein [bacterium]